MNASQALFPGGAVAGIVGSVFIQTTAVLLLAMFLSVAFLRRQPAARHAVWLAALACVLGSPLLAWTVQRSGLTVIEVPFSLFRDPPDSSLVAERTGALEPPSGEARQSHQPAMEIPTLQRTGEPMRSRKRADDWNDNPRSDVSSVDRNAKRADQAMLRNSHRQPEISEEMAETPVMPGSPGERPPSERLRFLICAGFVVWLVGSLFLLLRLVHGMRVVTRLVRSAMPLDVTRHEAVLSRVTSTLQVSTLPPISTSTAIDIPMACGVWRPVVLVPARLIAAVTPLQLHDLLVHESAHVIRGDPWIGLLQRLAAMVFWPHPLVYVANRELARAREELCDNYVLRSGDAGSYAQLLLAVLESRSRASQPAAVLAMISGRETLQSRVTGLLDERRNTAIRAPRRQSLLLGLLLLAVAVGISAARVVANDGLENPPPAEKPTKGSTAPRIDSASAADGAGQTGVADRQPGAAAAEESARDGFDRYGDPLPEGAIARLGTGRFQNGGAVQGLEFIAEGQQLLSAGGRRVFYWDVETGKKLREFHTAGEIIVELALSPDRRKFATLAYRFDDSQRQTFRYVTLWDVASGRREGQAQWNEPRGSECRLITYLPDGQGILTGSENGTLRVWDTQSAAALLEHKLPYGELTALAVSPSGESIAVAFQHMIYLWNWLSDDKPEKIYEGEAFRSALSLRFSPDGGTLAMGFDTRRQGVVLWDVAERKVVRILDDAETQYWGISEFAFTPDGGGVLAPSYNGRWIVHWDVATGQVIRRYETASMHPKALALSAHGRRVATTGMEGTILAWDVLTGDRLGPVGASHQGSVSNVAFAPEGRRVVTSSSDSTVRIWDAASGRHIRKLQHGAWASGFDVSPDGRWIATSSVDDTVRLWDFQTGEEIFRLPGHGLGGGYRVVAFTPDGESFATWGEDMFLRVWDVATGKALHEHAIRPSGIDIPINEVGDVDNDLSYMKWLWGLGTCAFSADANTFVFPYGRMMYVFDVRTGDEIHKYEADYAVDHAAISPDGRYVLIGGVSGQARRIPLANGGFRISRGPGYVIQMLDLQNGDERWRLDSEEHQIQPVAFSHDGSRIAGATSGERQEIRIWDAATGEELQRFERSSFNVGHRRGLAFSPDDNRLAIGTNHGTTLVWDLKQAGNSD